MSLFLPPKPFSLGLLSQLNISPVFRSPLAPLEKGGSRSQADLKAPPYCKGGEQDFGSNSPLHKMLLANLTKINIDNDPDMFSADGVAPLPPLPMAESGGSQSNQYLIDWGEQDLKSPKFGGFRG
jgi:hypothetical protein